MPLRSMSRAWGKFNALDLPTWSRRPLLSIYVRMFGCKLEEAAIEDLRYYKNLGEFFRRSLKPGMRPVATDYSLVSGVMGVARSMQLKFHPAIRTAVGFLGHAFGWQSAELWSG